MKLLKVISMMKLFPDPGVLPKYPEPKIGEKIIIEVAGEPPIKDYHFSIRNPKHRKYDSFLRLRKKAIKAMNGRKWSEGYIKMNFTFFSPKLDRSLNDYAGGIADTLDGSHGPSFTYLPIVYQDDCQICMGEFQHIKSKITKYKIEIIIINEIGDTK
jgi:hypothetical protein